MSGIDAPVDVMIGRPTASHWPEIVDVLRTANFHHIGSSEMETFPLEDCFAAFVDGRVRGVAGYRILSDVEAKTTLLAVDPRWAHLGLGRKLQTARLDHLRDQGIRTVTTNTDDPRVVRWLERKFGFRRTGIMVPKESDFGDRAVREWTNLRVTWAQES